VSNLVNVVDGVTPPILEHAVSWNDGLHCQAADTRQKTTNNTEFFELLAYPILKHITAPFTVHCVCSM
jgi:hypothetical protein